MRFWVMSALMLMVSQGFAADKSINIGVGLDYTPIASLRYDNNTSANFDLVDNTAWQGRISCNFGNGFSSGLIYDYMSKTIHPGSSTTTDITLWGFGSFGNYGYEITETGHALLVAGMESGYGELTDKSVGVTKSGGAPWVSGLIGTRFLIGGQAWLEIVYRLGWQEFSINQYPSRKYRFAGSSLRLSLDIPIYTISDKTEVKK